MTSCATHTTMTAEVQCAGCGKAICEECIAPGSDPARCFDCAINCAGEAVDRNASASRKRAVEVRGAPKVKRVSGWVKAIAAIGMAIIALQVAIIILLAKPGAVVRQATLTEPEKQAAAAAVANTILLSQGVENYREEHGAYPESLDALAAELPPELASIFRGEDVEYEKMETGGYRLTQTETASPMPLVFDSTTGGLISVEEMP